MNVSRVPRGTPTGGQWAASAKSESRVGLDTATRPAHHDVLDAACARHDVSADLPGVDGRSLQECWDETFEPLTRTPVESEREVIRDLMGQPDFGRECGGPDLVWYDPAISDLSAPEDDEPTRQWEDVTVENIDDARGRVLSASVYTRNGGGNRECWCTDEDHADGLCTAANTEVLQARADHLHDEDDDFDQTYATFYFRLPESPRLAQSVRDREEHREQNRANTLLDQIASGAQPPWAVLAHNPQTVALRAEAYARSRATGPTRPPGIAVPYLPTDEHVTYSKTLLDAIARNDVEDPTVTGRTPAPDRALGPSARLTKVLRERRATVGELEKVTAVVESLRTTTLPPEVVAYIGDTESLSAKAEDLRRAKDRDDLAVDYFAKTYRAQHRWMRDHLAAQQARAQATAETQRLDWAMSWPENPATCPPRPEETP